MNYIVINKKIEDAIRCALIQLKKEVAVEVYKEIEKVLLDCIMRKKLSLKDVDVILSLLKGHTKPQNEKIEEHISKKLLVKSEEKRNDNKSFNFIFYEHLKLVKLLNHYKKKMLCKPKGFQILKYKGRLLIMANPNACKNFRDSLKVTPSKSNAPKNTNANKNSSGGPGQKGNVGRTKGGNTR